MLAFTTDWHIAGGPRPELVAECDHFDTTVPDLLILGGDIGDPWEATWPEILSSAPWLRLRQLVERRHALGLATVWLTVNHDSNARPEYLPEAVLMNQLRIGKWLFMHGWEFDLQWANTPFGAFSFWLARQHPGLMVPIYHRLFTTSGQTVNYEAKSPREKWNLKVESGHSRARLYAQKTGLIIAVGHFHTRILEDDFFCDAGHNLGSTSWLEVAGDKAELKSL